MTISNFQATLEGAIVTCTWNATEDYSFMYADARMVLALPIGVTTWTGTHIPGTVYQAVDSATASPVPAALEPMPPKYMRITWDESAETDLAKYLVELDGVAVRYINSGSPNYTYTTNKLDEGIHTISSTAIDNVGNKLADVSEFTYYIEDSPPPVRSSALSQSGAGNITLTITAPIGWPTI